MKIQHVEGTNTFSFKAGARRTTRFLFLLSDFSTFGNPAKKPMKVRGNFRKCMDILLRNEINELTVVLKNGEYFEIGPPIFTRGRSKEDIEQYSGMYGKNKIKAEPAHFEVQITVPVGNAVKVYSIADNFEIYLVNEDGKFSETTDFDFVDKIAGSLF